MNRGFLGWLGFAGVIGGLAVACGGESTEFSKHDDDDSGGSGATGGATGGSSGTGGKATGGSSSKGGTGAGGTASGGTASGGTAGTGGMPEPPDGVCEDIAACGGDPEGTWNVAESCFEVLVPVFTEPGCENSPGRGSVDVSGTFTFEGGTMTTDLTATTHVTVVIDDACAQALFMSDLITAADLCPLIDSQFSINPDTAGGSCAAVPEGCRCDSTQPAMPSTSTDTYEILGNQLVLSDGSTMDYCQDGDQLHLHSDSVDVATSSLAGLTLLLDRAP